MNRLPLLGALLLGCGVATAQPQLSLQFKSPSDFICSECPDASILISTDAVADSLQVELAIEWPSASVGDFGSPASVTAATVLDPFTPAPGVNPFTGVETSGLEIDFEERRLFASYEATDLGIETLPFMDLDFFGTTGFLDVDATISIDGVTATEFSERIEVARGLPCGFGDYQCDGDVDIADFGAFADSFGSVTGDPNYDIRGDSEPDGDIDIADFGILADNFGLGTSNAVPEPSAVVALGALVASFLTRSVRR